VTFKSQLSIRLHESMTAKRILYPHHRLGRDVYLRLNNKPGDQTCKRKPGRMLVSHLQHQIEDVLKQKGILIQGSYKNWALFKTSSLLRAMGHRLCSIIFASSRCREEKAPILMKACVRSWP